MVSWGEIFVTVTAAGYLLGRKELPKIAHFVGLYSGRSVGAIVRAKKEFFDATKDSEIVKLQQEFQKGIAELNEIRSELTSVSNLARPLQPQGSSPAPGAAPATMTAAASAGGYSSVNQGASFAASSSAGAPVGPAVPGRSSLSLASMNYANLEADSSGERSAEASLAIAEMKLAEQGKYAPRLESVEGGADYVSASIVDSLLLQKRADSSSRAQQKPK
uniref:Uncharacterized protein n=1 Tax=Globisporangium ultimum (strain ATCC 200006 / CBS 805.95 / DAOM BR144) TaxID=431595 RepID=K3X1U0_GLOUD